MPPVPHPDDLHEERIRTNVLDAALVRRLLRYARPYRGRALLGLSLVTLSAFLTILPSALAGAMVDLVFTGREGVPARLVAKILSPFLDASGPRLDAMADDAKLLLFAGLFLAVRLATFLVDWGNGYLLAGLGQRVVHDIRMEIFTKIHSLSLSFFHRNPVGRLVTRTANDVGSLEEFFSVVLITLCKDVGMLLGIVVLLLTFEWRLALITLSVLPPMIIAASIFRRHSRAAYRRWRTALSRLNAFMAERLSGIRVVQLFGLEERNDRDYDAIGRDYKRDFLAQRRAWAYFRPVYTTLSAGGIGLVLWFGGYAALHGSTGGAEGDVHGAAQAGAAGLFLAGTMTVGLLTTFLGYAEQFFAPIRDITEKYDVLQGAMTSAERIFTILDEAPDIAGPASPVDPGRLRGEIAFESVRFSYIPGEEVLHGIELRIEPGQTVAIVGHTGAGKSTLIHLLGRFYDPQSGRIAIDGIDLRDYDLKGLRRNIAVVHQDLFLFSGTMLENVRLFDDSIDRERAIAACRAVGADRFIEALPGGYDAVVEESGKTLSVGERQLLSFARALVFDPAILILDEATSSVDTHTERMIERALVRLTRGRTSIVIAHRLSTIQRADEILVLHKGRLVEQGTHADLLASDGTYRRLYDLQIRSTGRPGIA